MGPPLFHCERCAKWWHAHCLPDSPSPETIINSPVWTCPQCLPASPSHPVPLQLCRVQWAPEWQGEKHIRSLIGGKEALLRFHQSRLPTTHAPSPPSPPPRRPPARHIAGKRRRTKPHTRSPPPQQPPTLTPNTKIILNEFDPDRDAPPTQCITPRLAPPGTSVNASQHPMITLHYPDGRIVSPTLLSPARYTWLHRQFCIHSTKPPEQFLPAPTSLLERYHPRAATINPQGRTLNLRNHWAIPSPLMAAIRSSLGTTTELYASPINCDILRPTTYFSAFEEDQDFGAIHDCHSYRWTGSCVANPE